MRVHVHSWHTWVLRAANQHTELKSVFVSGFLVTRRPATKYLRYVLQPYVCVCLGLHNISGGWYGYTIEVLSK